MADHGGGYEGFVAGIFSGVTKLAVGHPFDTVKVRLQTNPALKGPVDCALQTIRNEGVRGFYKGATPPLIGWMFMDSLLYGALTNYRQFLKDTVWPELTHLPFSGKVISAVAAGWTVSLVAAPIEHVKALLQVQYNAGSRMFTGPIDCAHKLLQQAGIRGLYKGLFATMLFRTNFAFFWGSYDIFSVWLKNNTQMSPMAINFWSGGLGATVFWTTAYPSDVIKQQIMTDDVRNPKHKSWMDACRFIYRRDGLKGYFRGFAPSIVRSFPANAAALAVFEASMRVLKQT